MTTVLLMFCHSFVVPGRSYRLARHVSVCIRVCLCECSGAPDAAYITGVTGASDNSMMATVGAAAAKGIDR